MLGLITTKDNFEIRNGGIIGVKLIICRILPGFFWHIPF